MRVFIKDLQFYFLNHIVNRIPCYLIRRACYRKAGMNIGPNSRILMGVFVQTPENIVIGDNTCINEYCYLDGRGGLQIGNNVSISMYTKILTGTHDSNSDSFAYKDNPVILHDNVWTGINSVILPGTELPHGSIIAAGSVAIMNNDYEEKGIYSGVPAKKIGIRSSKCDYHLINWKPRFR